MAPKELTKEQKQRRVKICQDLLERQDAILGHIITGYETCVYQYDPETKRQNAQGKTAKSPLPREVPSVPVKIQNNVANFSLVLDELFIMSLYQLDKQATKFTVWKHRKGCMKKIETTQTFFHQLMNLESRQCTCSHSTVCEGVLS
jgi:hypothetical protein